MATRKPAKPATDKECLTVGALTADPANPNRIAQLRRQYTRIQAAGGTRSRDFWAGALLALDELERLTAVQDLAQQTKSTPERTACH
jgi:hypothetical protein